MCRTSQAKRELVRVVRTPDGRVALDRTGKLAGRGAYVCAHGPCARIAMTRGALERALKSPIPPEVATSLVASVADNLNPTIEGGARGQE